MSTQEVCRLCLSEDNLMCVFDKRLEKTDHMKEVILITTGVEIHSKDVISQKICTKCGRDAVKMFQFRQQSLKNDRYLKAQCRELLKHTDLKIPNTNVTIKTERIDKEEIKQEPLPNPPYKVHPTMSALFKKYPQLQFPSTCLLSDVDPFISMEMDTVENYFKNRNLNMRKYVQLALRASKEVIPRKTSSLTKSLVKITENSQSTSTAISKTVGNADVVDKISPINIKLNQSGYAIVRPSTESFTHGEVTNVYESTSSCKKLFTGCLDSLTGISEPKKRRLLDHIVSEPETNRVPSANPSNTTSVHLSVEKISPPLFKCNICGSVDFSAENLKKHQIGHFYCDFCKTQFKCVGMKEQHINNSCLIKEAMDNMPDVQVERVEMNLNVRLHYQDAFTNFPPLPGLEKLSSASEPSKTAEKFIEIISDDEDTAVSTESVSSTKPVCSISSATTTSTVTKTSQHETPLLSLVIRPDVRMKNDNVLDNLTRQTPDLETIKELLVKFGKLQSATDEATQTELPTTESIRMKEGNTISAEFINLKQALNSYQIPVKIREGPINAFYNYQPTIPRPKILKLWDDLTPIDIKTVKTEVSELVVLDTTETHSNTITSDNNSSNISKSCDSLNNGNTLVQNIEILIPTILDGFVFSSDQSKSPSISTQTESLISTSDPTVVQAASLTSTSTRCSLINAPHSNSTTLEIFPLPASLSPVGDIPIRRQSPNSFGTDPTTHHINNHSLQAFPPQATSSITHSHSVRNYVGVDQTTSQNNAYINSESRGISPLHDKSDVNANWNSLNIQSEAMDCTTKARQELTSKVIEYVFNQSNESIDTGKINKRTPNSAIHSNNKKQPRLRIIKATRPYKKKNSQSDQSKRHVPATTNCRINGQSSYGHAPIQKNTLNDNSLFIRPPPPPYPNRSTPVDQTTRSYISSYGNTNNVSHRAETPQTSGYNNAFHQYISHLQELRSFQTNGLNNVAHHGETGHFTAASPLRNSFENSSMLQGPESFSHKGIESSTFPHYSMATNFNQNNCHVSNMQLPNSPCTDSSTLTACDTFTYSVPLIDKSKNFASGTIRVRNVSELT